MPAVLTQVRLSDGCNWLSPVQQFSVAQNDKGHPKVASAQIGKP